MQKSVSEGCALCKKVLNFYYSLIHKNRYNIIEIKYSDHDLIYVDLNVKVAKLKDISTTTRDYRKLRSNKKNFLNLLKNINWEVLKDLSNVNEMEKFWTQEINKCLDITAPWKKRRNKKKQDRRYSDPNARNG